MKILSKAINILTNFFSSKGLPFTIARNYIYFAFGLLVTGSPSIRHIADVIPLPFNKQVKVNKLWQLVNTVSSFKPLFISKILFSIASKLSKSHLIIIDFTSLKSHNIVLFIASISFKGRSIPFYFKARLLSDIHKLKYFSENDFIFKALDEISQIIGKDKVKRYVFVADRQFATFNIVSYFQKRNLNFIFRCRKNISIELPNGKVCKTGDLQKGKYIAKIFGSRYYIYVSGPRDGKEEKMIIVSNVRKVNNLHAVKEYLKRFECEGMHRDLKNYLNLLFLNKKYFKKLNEEKINKYGLIFMLAYILGTWAGKIVKNNKLKKRFISKKDERSYFSLGQKVFQVIETPKVIIRYFISSIINLLFVEEVSN